MRFDENVLDGTERLIYSLRDLYGKYGYRRYKMSKFEEYALYGRNIDFLVSDRVITFTDTDGKLMALKPDVTLSIVKNDRDEADSVTKLCYNENVYRVSRGSGTFREIMQSGLECIGNIDSSLVGEVLTLAAKSLELTGRKFVLELSHIDLLTGVIDGITGDAEIKEKLLKCVGEKNAHETASVCRGIGADPSVLLSLISSYGRAKDVTEKLSALPLGEGMKEAISELESALSVFDGTPYEDSVILDFSVTADSNYYNGIIFKGFVEGVPGGVLSGGQYDRLMKKMGKKSRAVGFAVYLDMLERFL